MVNALIKALIPAALLSWLVSTFLGSRGSDGGLLAIERISIEGVSFLWSWTLFAMGLALGAAIFKMMD